MIKKLIIAILTVLLVLTVVACNADGQQNNTEADTSGSPAHSTATNDPIELFPMDILRDPVDSSSASNDTLPAVTLKIEETSWEDFCSKMDKTQTLINVDNSGNIIPFEKKYDLEGLALEKVFYLERSDGSWNIGFQYKPQTEETQTTLATISFSYCADETRINKVDDTIVAFNMKPIDSENKFYKTPSRKDADGYDEIYGIYYPNNNVYAAVYMRGTVFFTTTDKAFENAVACVLDIYATFCDSTKK